NAGPSSGANAGLPSLRDTFPRKRGKGLFCAKQRKCRPVKRHQYWFLQAAQMLVSYPSSIASRHLPPQAEEGIILCQAA
ncbi:hypothetical protein HMPREF9080_01678, partial [Cardiobacterium valvarum F0432]